MPVFSMCYAILQIQRWDSSDHIYVLSIVNTCGWFSWTESRMLRLLGEVQREQMGGK